MITSERLRSDPMMGRLLAPFRRRQSRVRAAAELLDLEVAGFRALPVEAQRTALDVARRDRR